MENNYYQIYIDSVLQLASSIVVKSLDTANGVNDELFTKYGPNAYDPLNPRSWRYYLNLAGVYHPADEVMTVTSMDTLQTIEFTRENLEIHTATAKSYVYGSVHYKELVERYPKQERLIIGVLYPANLDLAVSSQDGTILSYPPHLVEDWEISLISKLQQWIYSYFVRWDNKQFKLSDNMYSPVIWGIMFCNLIPAIMNFRKAACKTNEAHSYHVRQYLASHGMLDTFMRFLTRKQILWLYRNIAYIERNSGKQAVFEWLTQHIMTERGIPLAAYEMRHDISAMPSELRTNLTFAKLPLNTQSNHDLRDFFTLGEVLDKEEPLATDNYRYREQEEARANRLMTNSLGNRLNTKLLESSMVDYSGSGRFTLADTLLYHWAYLSNENYYRAIVGFDNPISGEYVPLTAKEAFEFFVYLSCRSVGITLEHLPLIRAKRVAPVQRATLAELTEIVTAKRVSSAFAQEMLNLMPSHQVMISVDSFYDHAVELHEAALTQYLHTCRDGSSAGRGMKYNLISRCWVDANVQLGEEGQTYFNWFNEHNLNIDEFRQEDYAVIAAQLLDRATGVGNINAITLKDIQQAMVRLMAQLGSYSVHYVSTINSGPIIDTPTSVVRPDDWAAIQKQADNIITAVEVLYTKVGLKHSYSDDYGSQNFAYILHVERKDAWHYEEKVKVQKCGFTHIFTKRLPVGYELSYDIGPLPPNPRRITPVLGIETYLSLPLEEQIKIPDFWHMDP